LICNKVTFNGTTTPSAGSEDFNVAKNWKLRKTPFDGKTIGTISYTYATSGFAGLSATLRTAVRAGITEAQAIVPPYVFFIPNTAYIGDIIYADENPEGGTGVLDENGVEVTWLDQNRDGRAWAESL